VGRGERLIKLRDSSYSPKCISVQRREECYGGKATDKARGFHRLPNLDEL
jgi:hypothetical protein